MIELRDLCVAFGEKQVLDHFSLTLPERGVISLSGPSGCGKTTLARVLCFLQKPDSGGIYGLQPGQTSVMFQEDRLFPWRTVRQNLELVTSPRDAGEWLERMELQQEADVLPETLSGGMRRRVSLARALAFDGKLLILDEPFKGMDDALKQRLYPHVRAQAERRAVLLITHEAEEAQALAQRRLHLQGPPLCICQDE